MANKLYADCKIQKIHPTKPNSIVYYLTQIHSISHDYYQVSSTIITEGCRPVQFSKLTCIQQEYFLDAMIFVCFQNNVNKRSS